MYLLMEVHIPMGRGNFEGERGVSLWSRDTAVTCAKTAEPIVMPFGFWARTGPRNHELDGGPDPPWEGAILGKGSFIVKYGDFLPWAVQKLLNRSICHLGCGLGLAEVSEWVNSFLTAHQHILGHLVPYDAESEKVIKCEDIIKAISTFYFLFVHCP